MPKVIAAVRTCNSKPRMNERKKRRSTRKYCPGKCGRESRRCNKCKGASGVSLCKHGREWFRARVSCCDTGHPKQHSNTQSVTIMPVNKHTITKLTTSYKVGTQCTFHMVQHTSGKQMAKLSKDSSVQDMREILCIKDNVDLHTFAGVFDIRSLQEVLSKVE